MTDVLEFGSLLVYDPSLTTLLHYGEKKKQCSNVVREEIPLVIFLYSRTPFIFNYFLLSQLNKLCLNWF